MTEVDHVGESERLIAEGHKVVQKIRNAAPEDRDPYGKQAMGIWAQAQVHATLAVTDELKRMNDGRDQFHREVLDVLTRSSEGPSGAGATAQGGGDGD